MNVNSYILHFSISIGGDNPLIFVHANKYVGESLVIDNNAEIVGAACGNIAENVVFETDRESTVVFVEGSLNSYLGYVTLKFSPDLGVSVSSVVVACNLRYSCGCFYIGFQCTSSKTLLSRN